MSANSSQPSPLYLLPVEEAVAALATDSQRGLSAAEAQSRLVEHGRNELAARMPDYRFQPRTEPDTHHDRARLQWGLVVAGESFAAGTDVLEIDETGRIVSITGFVDRAPAGFDPDGHRR